MLGADPRTHERNAMYLHSLEASMRTYFEALETYATSAALFGGIILLIMGVATLIRRFSSSLLPPDAIFIVNGDPQSSDQGRKDSGAGVSPSMLVTIITGDGGTASDVFDHIVSVAPHGSDIRELTHQDGRTTYLHRGIGTLLVAVRTDNSPPTSAAVPVTPSSIRIMRDGRTLYGGAFSSVDRTRMADGYIVGHLQNGTKVTLDYGSALTAIVS